VSERPCAYEKRGTLGIVANDIRVIARRIRIVR